MLVGIAAGIAVLLVAAVVGIVIALRSDDDRDAGDASAGAKANASAETKASSGAGTRASGPGRYRAPAAFCGKLDLAPLSRAYGLAAGTATSESAADASTTACAVTLGTFQTSTVIAHVGVSVYGGTAESGSALETARGDAKRMWARTEGVQELTGAGEKAFGFLWDAETEGNRMCNVVVLDSNLVFSIRAFGHPEGVTSWTPADRDKVFGAMKDLATATIGKLG